MKLFYILIFSALVFSACFDIQQGQPFQYIAPNAWRGAFVTDATTAERVPVLFEVKSDEKGMPQKLVFDNGLSQTETDSLRFWGDTLYAYFGKSKSFLRLIYEVNLLEGKLYFENDSEYPLVFQAQSGKFPRFPEVRREPVAAISGIWQADFAQADSDTMQTLQLEFDQKENEVQALLKIGQINAHLSGSLQGNQLYLSGFDGGKVYFLSALVQNDKTLTKGKLAINLQKYVFNAQK